MTVSDTFRNVRLLLTLGGHFASISVLPDTHGHTHGGPSRARTVTVASGSTTVCTARKGSGALSALLCACDAFHALGLPCRVTTRKRAVAERALGGSPVLAADEGARAQRRAAAAINLDAAQRALVPYDFDSFKASTPAAPRERGRNGSWTFWYRGAPVVRPTGGHYAYAGGDERFALCV